MQEFLRFVTGSRVVADPGRTRVAPGVEVLAQSQQKWSSPYLGRSSRQAPSIGPLRTAAATFRETIRTCLDRAQHGNALKAQLLALQPLAKQVVAAQQEQGLESGLGLQVQFVGQPDAALAFESLGYELGKDAQKKIEVLSVRVDGDTTYANVFVPDGKLAHFEKYVEDCVAERKNVNGHALDHHALLNTISAIRRSEVRALWTDDPALLPQDTTEAIWWEVLLPVRGDRHALLADLRKLAALAQCRVSEHQISFPECTVVLMFCSERQFSTSVMTLTTAIEGRTH